MSNIGVILSGAGHLDGAEIHEAVLCLLALSQAGADVKIYAPDIELDEINHKNSEATGQKRNVLVEAARIARGKVSDVASVKGSEVDGWILPGGYGAAKNLCDFAVRGKDAKAHPEVARVVREALAGQVPIGACCIAPALLAVITKNSGPHLTLTIGNDVDTKKSLESMKAKHVDAAVDEIVVDERNHVVTAPAYMFGDAPISDVAVGINKMIAQVMKWADAG